MTGVQKLLAKCASNSDEWIKLLSDLIQSYLVNVSNMKHLENSMQSDETKKTVETESSANTSSKKDEETKMIDTTAPKKQEATPEKPKSKQQVQVPIKIIQSLIQLLK